MTNTTIAAAPVIRQPKPDVFERNGRAHTDSRQVAAFFGKTHRDVLRTIDNIMQIDADATMRNFAQGSYTHPSTGDQQHRYIVMDRDGFVLTAMSFTGKRALAWKIEYLREFNRMEAMLNDIQPPIRRLSHNHDITMLDKLDASSDAFRVCAAALDAQGGVDGDLLLSLRAVMDQALTGLSPVRAHLNGDI